MKRLFTFIIFSSLFPINIFSQNCLPNGIIFETQQLIDSFPTYYPGCRNIEGSVTIQGSEISHLDSLKILNKIKGNLTIQKTSQLISFHGLEQIDSIGGDLNIVQNQTLTDLSALSLLDTIRGDLLISQNHILAELTGLDSIKHIKGGLKISSNPELLNLLTFRHINSINNHINIQANSRLKHLFGLEGITFHNGALSIARNDSLLDYQGLDNLLIEKGKISLVQNPMAPDFTGFGSLHETGDLEIYDLSCRDLTGFNQLAVIKSTLEITKNSKLESFNGLPLLHEIQAYLWIENNDHIQNLEGLETMEEIFGLTLKGNDSLISLEGLNGLKSITKVINIINNPILDDLSVLINVHGLESDITISGNNSLQNLHGLDHLCETAFFKLTIENNPNLSICNNECICSHLLQDGMSTIDANSPGCNTRDEIIASCLVKTNDPVSLHSIKVYPNPTSQWMEIKGLTKASFQYTIFDVFGNRIEHGNMNHPFLDIQQIPSGLYHLMIKEDNSISFHRIVKF